MTITSTKYDYEHEPPNLNDQPSTIIHQQSMIY